MTVWVWGEPLLVRSTCWNDNARFRLSQPMSYHQILLHCCGASKTSSLSQPKHFSCSNKRLHCSDKLRSPRVCGMSIQEADHFKLISVSGNSSRTRSTSSIFASKIAHNSGSKCLPASSANSFSMRSRGQGSLYARRDPSAS